MARNKSEFCTIAQVAHSTNVPSPYIASSANDQAHHVGLWARRNDVLVVEVKSCRGHKWLLNRKFVLDFKNDNYEPSVEIDSNY